MAERPAPTHPVREFASENPRGLLLLWLGVLLPPLAFLCNLEFIYMMVPWSCVERVHGTLHLVPLATLLVDLAAGALAWREWHRTGAEWPGEGGGVVPRSRFLATLGLLESAFFALLILAQWTSILFIEPCARG